MYCDGFNKGIIRLKIIFWRFLDVCGGSGQSLLCGTESNGLINLSIINAGDKVYFNTENQRLSMQQALANWINNFRV